MKRIRLILALSLCLALACLCSTGLAAPKAATAVPTLKVSAPKGTLRGGVEQEITVTPSVPGFLTLRMLDDSGAEVALICENQEVHTKANVVTFDMTDGYGEPLPTGSYVLSGTVTSQYGVTSKEATAKFKLGEALPRLLDVSMTATKAFNPTISFNASFFDKEAEVALSCYRLSPKAAYVDDFPRTTLKTAGMASATLNLAKGNDLPTAAGYYRIKAVIYEVYSSIYGNQMEIDFVVDLNGSVYLLDEAPAETLLALDALVADFNAGTLDTASLPKMDTADSAPAAKNTAGKTAAASSGKTGGTNAAAATAGTGTAAASNAGASGAAAAAPSDELVYAPGIGVIGDEGYEIGAGVGDTVPQTDAGYWSLSASATDAEIWAALTRTMTSVEAGENESAYIYNSTAESRKRIGTVSGLSHGLNVIKELDNGWSLVETYRVEDGAFVRGYIRSNKLRIVEPNQTYGLVIDKAAQKLTVWKNGAPIGSCSVTTGLPTAKYPQRETPAGEYILVTRRGTTEYPGKGFSKFTVRFSGAYHISEIPTTKKNGSDYSMLADSLGTKATRGNICIAHDASTDGGINAEWIWNLTKDNKKIKLLILDDKDRTMVPVSQ